MGLATSSIDPHSQKVHTKIHKIPKFGVNQAVLTEKQRFLKKGTGQTVGWFSSVSLAFIFVKDMYGHPDAVSRWPCISL